jgi:hypothetical protein|tara:strand:+ start:538 stop:855 length:318 start_codon:yes stop_codon:yes gene_type:complete
VDKILKTFISFGLSIMLLSTALHVDLHHEDYDGYSICNTDCIDAKHHLDLHQCIKCLNKNSDSLIFSWGKNFFHEEIKTPNFPNHHLIESAFHFNLFSRPPPKLL